MKIKSERIILIFLASAVLSSLTACEKEKTSGNTFTDTRFVSMSTSSYSSEGEYMVSADDNRLHYWDINSSTETVICADPSCTHDTYNETDNPYPECTAVTSDGSVFGNTFIYSDKLYYFSNSGLNSTTLYVCDKNGKNKRKIHEFECDMAALTAPVTGERKLFFLMQTAIVDASETSGIAPEEYNYTLFSFEFDSKKLSTLKEFEKPKQFSLRSLYVHENCLYYEFFTSDASYSDIYDFETGQYKDDPIKHDSRKIVRLNLSDNSEEILYDSSTTRLIGGDGDKLYISQKETEDYSLPDSRIIEYSLSDGSVRDVLVQDGDYYSAGIFNRHIIYTNVNDIVCVNISTGDTKTIVQNGTDIYTFAFATEKYAVLKKTGISEIYAAVPFSEFVNGSIGNMRITEFENLSLIQEGV